MVGAAMAQQLHLILVLDEGRPNSQQCSAAKLRQPAGDGQTVWSQQTYWLELPEQKLGWLLIQRRSAGERPESNLQLTGTKPGQLQTESQA